MNKTNEQKLDYLTDNSTILNLDDDLLFLLKKHNVSYTKNNNGIFLNISLLKENVIDDIYTFFYTKNNSYNDEIIDNFNPQITECNINYNNTYVSTNNDNKIKKKKNKFNKLDSAILKELRENLNLI